MDLECHQALQLAAADLGVEAVHRDLDDVGGRALDGHVDGGTLGGLTDVAVAGADLGDVAAAAEERFRVAVHAHLRHSVGDVLLDSGILLEVGLDEGSGLFARDAFAEGEAVFAEAVEDAEVEDLGPASHLGRHLVQGDAEDLRGGRRVDVLVALEGADERGVLRDVGHDAQLDLGVVGGEELRLLSDVAGDESAADLSADIAADGDVLQIGVAGREAAGGSARLVELRVDALRLGVDEERERVEIRRLELGQFAVAEDEVDDRMDAAHRLERVLVGGVRAALETARLGQADLVEEHLGELSRRADVEFVADVLVDLFFEAVDLLRERLPHLVERARVDGDAGQLHAREDEDQRHLDVVEELLHPLVGDLRCEGLPEAADSVGAGAGDVGSGGDFRLVDGDAVGLLAPVYEERIAIRQLAVEAASVQPAEREVALFGPAAAAALADEEGGDHRVELDASQLDTVVGEHYVVELNVMSGNGHFCPTE